MSDAAIERDYQSEIQQKVGRNVILLQQLELMLKYLLTFARIEVRGTRVMRGPQDNNSQVAQKTLGPVVDQYLREVLYANDKFLEDEADPNEVSFKFCFRTDTGKIAPETKKQALEAIVNERNELIHNLLPRIKPDRPETYEETIEFLDDQFNNISPYIEEMKSQCAAVKNALEYLASDCAQREVELAWLRQSRLVLLLGDIAAQMARQDGWALMSHAGQLAQKHAPGEMLALREKYGHKTLKQLLIATELFDLKEEATEKGIRVLYRLKPEWKLGHT
jgi:hypothetical protein